jgi:diguanylate cyclase (GGDEF)-like protein/PAS domain S-box-containing protein
MSVRTKIIIIVVPLMLISILAVNLIFGAFFSMYLQGEEDSNISKISKSVNSYVLTQEAKFQGSANDWGNWDDTYKFMIGDKSYIDSNLDGDTFTNLDINFFILLNKDGTIYEKRYYDLEKNQFRDFDASFIIDFYSAAASFASGGDISAIYKFGGSFYYAASSDVTDSSRKLNPKGKLIIGRELDIPEIEKLTGCTVTSVEEGSPDDISMEPDGINKKDKTLEFSFFIPGRQGAASIIMNMAENRDMFLNGMEEMNKYMLGGLLYSLVISAVLFTLLGVYLTGPFFKLSRDVKKIDLKDFKKIEVKGNSKDEFSLLRNTINSLLERAGFERAAAKENEEKLYATLLSVGDGVIVVGRDSTVQIINPTAQKLTGWTQEEATGMHSDEVFRLVNEMTGEALESPVKEVFETQTVVELANHTLLISRDGSEKAIEDSAAPIKDKNGEIIGCVIVFRDFTERKEKQKRIEFLSYHDQLTGLYNRRYFEEELKRLDTSRNLPISIVYADINGLKAINDAFGHNNGDQLICKAAGVLKDVCRADEIISRTGGDEFVILLPKTDMPSTEKMVGRIEKKLEKVKVMGLSVSLSFGWDTKYVKTQSIWDTLKSAEGSMYHKKILISSGIKDAVIDSVVTAFHAKYPSEKGHSERIGAMSAEMGRLQGMSGQELEDLKKAGEFHDLGKITIDEEIINNTGKLTESEWMQVKSHPETGYRILSTSSGYYNIAEYVLEHHERWDGKGYPKGLKGDDITIQSRIMMIVDAFDQMTHEHSYRAAMSENDAVKELKKNSGSQFDPNLVRVFIEKVLKRKY